MNYHNITYPDQNNGDGLRVVLWLSGCSHHCKGCQNPQTWDTNSGVPFDESAKEEIFKELNKDYISGITLSGGDPLNEANLDGVLGLVNQIRLLFPQKTIWLYTGYRVRGIQEGLFVLTPNVITDKISDHKEIINRVNEDVKRSDIIKKCDVLIDGRYIEEKRDITLKWRGSSNQRVINVQKSLQKNEIVLHCD